MVDDVKDITETAESKEALDRARLSRERREAEQRKRLDELRAHAAAAQAQREKRDEDRRRRQAEQRQKDDERRLQVEERKRAIWEASISRREALLQRERDRTERLERQRAARSAPRPAFAFGSSTPRLLEPVDSAGFFWAARRAASTTNVMFASAPLTRRASALQLDTSDTDNKDEPERTPQPIMWSSVARRRTDLVPTVPAPRAPETRSGDTTPGSRPGSALSNATGVIRRPTSAPRKPRPASIAGTGVNTPRGGGDTLAQSCASTPSVSRDSTQVMGGGDVPRRANTTPRRPRPNSLHAHSKPGECTAGSSGHTPHSCASTPSVSRDSTQVMGGGDVPRRANTTPRRPRPNSLHAHSKPGECTAGSSGHTPHSCASTPSVSRDSTQVMGGGDVPRRANTTPRRPRPNSLHAHSKPGECTAGSSGHTPHSCASTPSVSRDSTQVMGGGDVPRRANTTPRRPRPNSLHAHSKPGECTAGSSGHTPHSCASTPSVSRDSTQVMGGGDVPRRANTTPRRPRPNSLHAHSKPGECTAGSSGHTPHSCASTPSVSRDSTQVMGGGDVPRRANTTPRRPRPNSLHAHSKPGECTAGSSGHTPHSCASTPSVSRDSTQVMGGGGRASTRQHHAAPPPPQLATRTQQTRTQVMGGGDVPRRANTTPRRPRPNSLHAHSKPGECTAGSSGHTPHSCASTPSVSRDSTQVMGGGDVPRRANTTPRRPRPNSLHAHSKPGECTAGSSGHTPHSCASTPSVSRDSTQVMGGGDVPRRANTTPRRPRPNSLHAHSKPGECTAGSSGHTPHSCASTPSVSRDSTQVMGGGDVPRRANTTPRRPRPNSLHAHSKPGECTAGSSGHTPHSCASTPSVSRDSTQVMGGGDVPRRANTTPRRPRPNSLHAHSKPGECTAGSSGHTPHSCASTPSVSRDSTQVMGGGDVPRRANTTPRRPRPNSLHAHSKPGECTAGSSGHTPHSCASTPSVSRDSTQVMGGGDVPRRANTTPRRPRPNSLHAHSKPGECTAGSSGHTPHSCASTPSVSRDSTQVMGGGDVPRRANTTPRRPRPNSLHAHSKPGECTAGSSGHTPHSCASTPSVSRDSTQVMGGGDVPRRANTTPRRPRPNSLHAHSKPGECTAGSSGHTPHSCASTPSVSRDSTQVMGGGDVPRRANTTPRRPRPNSLHAHSKPAPPTVPGEGKPPLHRKPKPSKEHDKAARGKSLSASPGRALSPPPPAHTAPPAHPAHIKDPSAEKDVTKTPAGVVDGGGVTSVVVAKSQVDAVEVTQKLEALQIQNGDAHVNHKANEIKEAVEDKQESKIEQVTQVTKQEETVSQIVKKEEKREEREEKKESSVEKTDENEMTASMSRRITTEEQAKAALAERRRRAREELERQAELERQRIQREAEEEAERQRQEEERQRREEEEARELAQLQRKMEEEKLRKAIEAQQQLEREEASRKVREEAERQARAREDEEKRRAAEEAERLRREEAEREERERLVRKQRVEAIMARTRLRKQAEEDKSKSQAVAAPAGPPPPPPPAPAPAPPAAADNGNEQPAADLLALNVAQAEESKPVEVTSTERVEEESSVAPAAHSATNNGNVTADLLGLSHTQDTGDKTEEQTTATKLAANDNAPSVEPNNGNSQLASVGHISANFIQTERMSNETQTKMSEVPNLLDDDFTTHNGHGTTLNHPLTLQNAI
ncbi:unnamed protein product [Arctia plantaginis]|uniref:Ensconsin-like n=1 Tax=Arctia plantaginis TaxID=874455 RepID=A0A8S0ZKA8_ARCPL|nr:unnamed protein product [Arctia plantaginis]